jgi:TFIIF-interacting CTD phosphatase-like protein
MEYSSSNRINVILDLDQTLISAEPSEEFDFDKNRAKSKHFTYHDMEGYYIVFERPHLQEFLNYLFANFNVSIWTAATMDYALFVIENVILKNHPGRKIDYIFFDYHVNLKANKGTKDLNILYEYFKLENFSKENTIILDDLSDVYKTQPEKTIIAPEFQFTERMSDRDNFLLSLVPYLDRLKAGDISIEGINNVFSAKKKKKRVSTEK